MSQSPSDEQSEGISLDKLPFSVLEHIVSYLTPFSVENFARTFNRPVYDACRQRLQRHLIFKKRENACRAHFRVAKDSKWICKSLMILARNYIKECPPWIDELTASLILDLGGYLFHRPCESPVKLGDCLEFNGDFDWIYLDPTAPEEDVVIVQADSESSGLWDVRNIFGDSSETRIIDGGLNARPRTDPVLEHLSQGALADQDELTANVPAPEQLPTPQAGEADELGVVSVEQLVAQGLTLDETSGETEYGKLAKTNRANLQRIKIQAKNANVSLPEDLCRFFESETLQRQAAKFGISLHLGKHIFCWTDTSGGGLHRYYIPFNTPNNQFKRPDLLRFGSSASTFILGQYFTGTGSENHFFYFNPPLWFGWNEEGQSFGSPLTDDSRTEVFPFRINGDLEDPFGMICSCFEEYVAMRCLDHWSKTMLHDGVKNREKRPVRLSDSFLQLLKLLATGNDRHEPERFKKPVSLEMNLPVRLRYGN